MTLHYRWAEFGQTEAGKNGLSKEKIQGGVSLLFFSTVASGFQDVSQDNRLGKGLGCSQVQEGQSDHRPRWLAPGVYCAQWERVSIRLQAIKRVGITEP